MIERMMREMRLSQESTKASGHAASMQYDEGVRPQVGGVYTVSPDFQSGDRSWLDCFWNVLSLSGPYAFVKIRRLYI